MDSIEVAGEPSYLSIRDPLVMKCQIIIAGSKPFQHFSPVYQSDFRARDYSIRRIFPIAKVCDKPMLLWILVDVGNHVPELPICCNRNSPKRVLEQTACPPISLVDRLGIGVEEVGELITDVMRP